MTADGRPSYVASLRPPAPRPCESCPYRRDAPSGVWGPTEYEKLRGYDEQTGYQPTGVFQCHQSDYGGDRARVCAGWAAVHARNPRGHELMALRLAVPGGVLSAEDCQAVWDYTTDVPLFGSGAEAAEHGLAEIDAPGEDATRIIEKVRRSRTDVLLRDDDDPEGLAADDWRAQLWQTRQARLRARRQVSGSAAGDDHSGEK